MYRKRLHSERREDIWRRWNRFAEYRNSIDMLHFASKWLYANQREEGNWDMGSEVKDGIYFPLSDNWKKKENRIADCTWRIRRLLDSLKTEIENQKSEVGTGRTGNEGNKRLSVDFVDDLRIAGFSNRR